MAGKQRHKTPKTDVHHKKRRDQGTSTRGIANRFQILNIQISGNTSNKNVAFRLT